MEKKLWSNAELVELGVESTREDYSAETMMDGGQERIYYRCKNCGEGAWLSSSFIKHKSWCVKNDKPVLPGGDLDGGCDIGVTPLS